jgi:hypothetical protein
MTVQQTPYIQEQRHFPRKTVEELATQMDIAYIDIARKINERMIGQHSKGFSAVTGERWFLDGQVTPQQTLRQVYEITSTLIYAHGIDTTQIEGFTKIYGVGYDGTNWFSLPHVDSTLVTNQIGVLVTPTQIVLSPGAGAPVITSGFIILEWLAVF